MYINNTIYLKSGNNNITECKKLHGQTDDGNKDTRKNTDVDKQKRTRIKAFLLQEIDKDQYYFGMLDILFRDARLAWVQIGILQSNLRQEH